MTIGVIVVGFGIGQAGHYQYENVREGVGQRMNAVGDQGEGLAEQAANDLGNTQQDIQYHAHHGDAGGFPEGLIEMRLVGIHKPLTAPGRTSLRRAAGDCTADEPQRKSPATRAAGLNILSRER